MKGFLIGAALFGAMLSMSMAAEVINAGKGGNNTRNLLKRWESDALVNRPDLVILGCGTNDAINSGNFVPLAEFDRNLKQLIGSIRASGAKVIIMTPLPCIDEYVLTRHSPAFYADQKPSEKIKAYLAVMKKRCKEEDVLLVDLYDLFVREGNIGEEVGSWLRNLKNSRQTDGVHPTPTGYKAIAQKVREEISKARLNPKVIVCFGDSITFGAGAKTASRDESYPAVLQGLLEAAPLNVRDEAAP